MATRARIPKNELQAAALVLEDKGANSLLYNTQVLDYLTNSVSDGSTHLAWMYYGKIPELRYTARYIANALSVATFYVGMTDGSGSTPSRLPKSHPAYDLMADFGGGQAGQSELLDRLGLHLTVAGDSVLIGPLASSESFEAPFDQWRVYSTEEVSSRNGRIYLQFPGNAREVQIPPGTTAIRVWRPHPRQWWDADSPVKGSFSVLRELDLMDQHIHASAISRLAGAGMLLIPEELDLPGSEMEIEGTEIDRFVAMLTEVMGLAIKNRESAAALVPIILRGPSEFLNAIKHLEFSTPFSEQVPELRTGAIRRLALGMDVPPEILLGSGSSTSWSAWQTDESTLRVHLIPMLQLIASSLTAGWLQPALDSIPMSEAQREEAKDLVVHYDVSNLKIRQDVSGDAQAMYDRLEIDADSLRNALGFSQDSAPDDEETARQILLQLVRGNPQMASYAINALRENFGLTKLPVAPDAAESDQDARVVSKEEAAGQSAPVGAPIETPKPEPGVPSSPVPGERSQNKQTSPPPVPKIGDNSNNEVK